jgi:hypothetical protein
MTVVFELDTSFGFFSVFFFLCKSYIYAKNTNQQFYIHHNEWGYDGGKGWHGYFTTLECYPGNPQATYWIKHGNMPCNIPTYSLTEYIECIPEIFILQPELLHIVETYIDEINGPYIAIYIRRGDKYAESAFISESDILSKVVMSDCNTIFIQTDDYSVVECIRNLLPDKKVLSRVSVNKHGHYQNKIYLQNARDTNPYKDEARAFNDTKDNSIDTVEFLTSCIISMRAKACWVDYSSNVGRFLKLASPETVHAYAGRPFEADRKMDPYWSFK